MDPRLCGQSPDVDKRASLPLDSSKATKRQEQRYHYYAGLGVPKSSSRNP
jgi:hypothetical protein